MTEYGRFIEIIKEALIRERYSARELALAVGITPSYLTRILAGERNPPSDEHIKEIARILKLDQERLLWEAGRLPGCLRATRPLTDDDLKELRKFSEEMRRRHEQRRLDAKHKPSPKS